MGENGGFLRVSGITFTVDTAVESSVVLDDNGMFVSCGDARRVKEVRVVLLTVHTPVRRDESELNSPTRPT